MVAAEDSIIPEFTEKMELESDRDFFHVTKKEIINKFSGSQILFRGIKTSSGNQIGVLKGIQGLTTFIQDEGEEWQSASDYDTMSLSIRTAGIQNRVITIMNPTDDSHFIYEKYIKDTHKIIQIDGVDVQVSTHPDVLHIHTCYLDNLEHLSDKFLNEVKGLKAQHDALPDEEKNFSTYATKVIGRWSDVPEGVIFKNVEYIDEFDKSLPYNFGLDFGFHPDPDVLVKVAVDTKRKIIYVQELFMKHGQTYDDLYRRLSRFCTPENQIVADTNEGRARNEMTQKGFHVVPAKKGAGSVAERLKAMQEYKIFIVGDSSNLKEAFRKYKWDDKKAGIPVNKFKHFPDATGYAFDYLTTEIELW
jgi:phage terminase large subunit